VWIPVGEGWEISVIWKMMLLGKIYKYCFLAGAFHDSEQVCCKLCCLLKWTLNLTYYHNSGSFKFVGIQAHKKELCWRCMKWAVQTIIQINLLMAVVILLL
jgi:hypothetical protein